MEKEVSIRELKGAESGLIKICNFEYPAKLAVKLTDFLESVIPHYQEFEDLHKELSLSLGKKTKADDTVEIKEKNMSKYQKDLDKLLDKTVKIPQVKFTDLEPHLTDTDKLTPAEVRSLRPIIEFS